LQIIQFSDMPVALFQGFDDGSVLQAFLYNGLDTAVALPDFTGVAAHSFHIEAATQ